MNSLNNQLLCPNLKLYKKGKVREVYDFNDKLLIVATDQISAFDVILPNLITGKGSLLTQISNFWFNHFQNQVKHHIVTTNIDEFPSECYQYKELLKDRAVLVWKTEMIEIEAIVRGYLSGSGYKDYQNTGEVCGIKLPEGLLESAKLQTPLFTPSTKAQEGHDMNISEADIRKQFAPHIIDQIKEKSLYLYTQAAEYALQRGIIIADTKFEFGLLNDEIILIDEILTPDSSRFWPANDYEPGCSQKSFDKQIIRDYLNTLDWDKNYPGPKLPDEIIQKTIQRYQEVYDLLKS